MKDASLRVVVSIRKFETSCIITVMVLRAARLDEYDAQRSWADWSQIGNCVRSCDSLTVTVEVFFARQLNVITIINTSCRFRPVMLLFHHDNRHRELRWNSDLTVASI